MPANHHFDGWDSNHQKWVVYSSIPTLYCLLCFDLSDGTRSIQTESPWVAFSYHLFFPSELFPIDNPYPTSVGLPPSTASWATTPARPSYRSVDQLCWKRNATFCHLLSLKNQIPIFHVFPDQDSEMSRTEGFETGAMSWSRSTFGSSWAWDSRGSEP